MIDITNDRNKDALTKLNFHCNQVKGCITNWKAKDEISLGMKKTIIDYMKQVCKLTQDLVKYYEQYERAKDETDNKIDS